MKHSKPKYAVNVETGEIHKLKNITGSCHLPEDAKQFINLDELKAAGFSDRCGHCWPKKKAKVAE